MINMNDFINQYAMQAGILNSQGQMAAPPQQSPQPTTISGLLSSPAMSNALLSLGSTIAQANQQGYGLGGSLAMGAQAFGGAIQADKERREKAQKEATQDRLAALKDIISLKTQQEELGLRMQAASLARRAQQDQLDQKAQERAQQEARKQAVYASGDPNLIKAYEMFGDDAAQTIYMEAMKPKERKTITQGGVAYYQDTGEPVLPNAPSDLKQTDTYRKENDLAREALDALTDTRAALYDEDGSLNRLAINTGMMSTGGRNILQPLETAIGNTVYLKTGAAATPGEIASLMKQYAPSPLDTKDQADRKLKSLEQFLSSKAPDYQPKGNMAKKPDAQSGFKFLGVE